MKAYLSHRVPFNAAHTVDVTNLTCGEFTHGHDWYAQVDISGTPDHETGLFESDGPVQLERIITELHGRDMNKMLPGVPPTAAGVAGWILERMRMSTPGLTRVTVGFTSHSVSLEV